MAAVAQGGARAGSGRGGAPTQLQTRATATYSQQEHANERDVAGERANTTAIAKLDGYGVRDNYATRDETATLTMDHGCGKWSP